MDLLAIAPSGGARLRELILTLAVQGKLVPQDPADEPASVLPQKIRAEKDRLIADRNRHSREPLRCAIRGKEKGRKLVEATGLICGGAGIKNKPEGRIKPEFSMYGLKKYLQKYHHFLMLLAVVRIKRCDSS